MLGIRVGLFVLALGALLVGGCATPDRPTGIAKDAAATREPEANGAAPALEHADVYDGVHEQFARAVFYKPRQREGLPFELQMAPLIVQQVTGDTAPRGVRFGPLKPGTTDVADVNAPTVYYGVSTAFLRGHRHEQLTFVWFYARPVSYPSCLPGSTRGVRMTLDADGFPLVWEAGGHVYVSRWMEDTAFNEFGPPMPGRKYSIESAHPVYCGGGVIVPRILDDGPVPMGPFVYLRAGDQSVSTLLCRCMPSQVDEFVETVEYELVPTEELGSYRDAFFGVPDDDRTRLEKCLRFPELE